MDQIDTRSNQYIKPSSQPKEEMLPQELRHSRIEFVKARTSFWIEKIQNSSAYQQMTTEKEPYKLPLAAQVMANVEFGIRQCLELKGLTSEQIDQKVPEIVLYSDDIRPNHEGSHFSAFYFPKTSTERDAEKYAGWSERFGGKISVYLPILFEYVEMSEQPLFEISGSKNKINKLDQYLLIGVEEASHLFMDEDAAIGNQSKSSYAHLSALDLAELENDLMFEGVGITQYGGDRKFAPGVDASLLGTETVDYHYNHAEYQGLQDKMHFANQLGIPNSFESLFKLLTELRQRSEKNLVQWE